MTQQTRTELMPGVHFRAIHTEKFKSAYLSVTFMAPLNKDTAAVNALLPYVLRRGSCRHESMEAISAALDELYGGAIEPVVRKKGETQCVGFVASFLDDAFALEGENILEPAAQLLGELLLQPRLEDGRFCREYVAGEKANLIDRIRGQINDKRTYASLRLKQLMCQDEAYGVDVWGEEQSAAAITDEQLWQQYQQLLATCEVEVYYCGSAQPERAQAALKQALAALPRSEELQALECEIRLTASAEPQIVEEAMDVSQGKLAMGFRTGGMTVWEEDYPALLMLNAVFGGTSLSKLFMNVREKLSLCYYASSLFHRQKKMLTVSSGIEFANYQQAYDEILAQLDAVKRGELEDWELVSAKNTLTSAYRSMSDSQGKLENFYLGQSATGNTETPEDLARQVEEVMPERIFAAMDTVKLDTVYFLRGKEAEA